MREKINNINTSDVISYIDEFKNINFNTSKFVIRSRKLIERLTINSKNYGKLRLVDYYRKNGDIYFIGKFIKTGYVNRNIHYSQIKTGNIKDMMYPKISGIGYLGEDFHEVVKDIELHKILYSKWTNMINRCYNKKSANYANYGNLGVRVSKRWYQYSNFFEDAQKLDGYDRNKIINGDLSLDKDKYQISKNKCDVVYSKNTCCWLSVKEQNSLVNHNVAQDSLKKCFLAIFPDGREILFKGIGEFSRKYNLDSGDCSRAINGKIPHVKNIRFKKVNEE